MSAGHLNSVLYVIMGVVYQSGSGIQGSDGYGQARPGNDSGDRVGPRRRADHRAHPVGDQGDQIPPGGAVYFTSGWKSPVYIDCRRIIYFPRARAKICDLAVEKIDRHVGYETIEAVAGGETAGIPFAAWIADRMARADVLCAQEAQGFGRQALIEGDVPEGKRTLLVEDLTTDGQSKIRFANALRDAGAIVTTPLSCSSTAFSPARSRRWRSMDIALHHLCTWWDVLEACKDRPYFSESSLSEVRRFLENPVAWSAAHGGIASAEEAMARKAAADS